MYLHISNLLYGVTTERCC